MNKIRISFDIEKDLHLIIRRFAGLQGEPISYYLKRVLWELHTEERFSEAFKKIKLDKGEARE